MEIESVKSGLTKKAIVQVDNEHESRSIILHLPSPDSPNPLFWKVLPKLKRIEGLPLVEQYPRYVTLSHRQLRKIGERMLFGADHLDEPSETREARFVALEAISDYFAEHQKNKHNRRLLY